MYFSCIIILLSYFPIHMYFNAWLLEVGLDAYSVKRTQQDTATYDWMVWLILVFS